MSFAPIIHKIRVIWKLTHIKWALPDEIIRVSEYMENNPTPKNDLLLDWQSRRKCKKKRKNSS